MLDQFHHVLVPLDFSDKNEIALKAVLEIVSSAPAPAHVSLLHVIEPIGILDDSGIERFTDQLREHADKELLKIAQRFSGLNVTVSCENRLGHRAREAVAFADENKVDLIVLNSHRIKDNESRHEPGLSYQIAILADCSVLLLK
jgi:nucleotide-binding universal stress UspA family protein